MTTLLITPKVENKTAKFKGTIAAGEHVAVTIKDGAEWSAEGLTLRVIDLTTQRTLAVFPRPEETLADGEEPDAWDTNAGDLTCTLNLNTTRMVAAARHMLRVPVMFVLGNSSEDERTLYFRDCYEVELWPERIGDDTPYDLDKWPKQIDEWTEQMEDWARQMQSFNTALSEEAEARANGDAPLAGQTINTNTTNAMRQAIKTIGAALGATMRVLAVCVALPLLGATVQTAPLGELDLDTNPRVVTNVTFEGLLTEHQDISGKADKTNTYTKAETDAKIVELSPPTSLKPATNYTDSAIGDFARTNNILKAGPYLSSTGGVVNTKGGITLHYTGVTLGAWPQNSWITPHSFGMFGGFLQEGIEFQDRNVYVSKFDRRVTMHFPLDESWEDGADVGDLALRSDIPIVQDWAKAPSKPTYTASEVGATDGETVTNIVREVSLGGIWDQELCVWWTPIMQNGALRYVATTNVNLNAGN